MADIKKLTEVSIQQDGVQKAKGLIYIHADRVIDLDKVVKQIVETGTSNIVIHTSQIEGLDTYVFSVSQVNGLDQKLEEAKTEWIII